MSVKKIKGRSLPGRSEEPSPERPTTTISTPEAKGGAQQHPGERSAFEVKRRQAGEPQRRTSGGGEDPLEQSAFEAQARGSPRLEGDAALPVALPRQEEEEGVEHWGAAPPKDAKVTDQPDEEAEGLWADGYEEEGDDDQEPSEEETSAPDDLWDQSQARGAQPLEDPVVGDLWVPAGPSMPKARSDAPVISDLEFSPAPVVPIPAPSRAAGEADGESSFIAARDGRQTEQDQGSHEAGAAAQPAEVEANADARADGSTAAASTGRRGGHLEQDHGSHGAGGPARPSDAEAHPRTRSEDERAVRQGPGRRGPSRVNPRRAQLPEGDGDVPAGPAPGLPRAGSPPPASRPAASKPAPPGALAEGSLPPQRDDRSPTVEVPISAAVTAPELPRVDRFGAPVLEAIPPRADARPTVEITAVDRTVTDGARPELGAAPVSDTEVLSASDDSDDDR